MRPSTPIIVTLILIVASTFFQVGCSGQPAMVLESDIPNVDGFESIVTRDIQRQGDQITAVEVLYRGDVVDTNDTVNSTRHRFIDAGWELVSQQAKGKTTILNFTKDSRTARVEIALNQIEPMMSPALLRVWPTGSAAAAATPSSNIPGAATATSGTIMPEGFAPPPNK